MGERAGDLRDAVRRLEHALALEVAAELVLLLAAHGGGDVGEGLCERLCVAADDARDGLDGIAALDRTRLLRLDVACLLRGDGVGALVPDRPSHRSRLAMHLERLL